MPNSEKHHSDKGFDDFFREAECSPAYWVELAKVEFTEGVIARMQELSLSKSELAKRLEVSPAMVTRIVSGQNNFELATMVKIARALGCEFRSHLQRPEYQTGWINFLTEDPEEKTEEEWRSVDQSKFKNIFADA